MKPIFLLILCMIYTSMSFSQKYITKNGQITFEASMPSFEEVKASSNSASAIFNSKTGEIASLVFINGFHFKVSLMEEHFNENYMESHKYPKAYFNGSIIENDYKGENNKITIKGQLNIRGVIKDIIVICDTNYENDTINIKGIFKINPSDFNINIPKLMKSKIAENVQIEFNFLLHKQ